jgi:hypothetical protein
MNTRRLEARALKRLSISRAMPNPGRIQSSGRAEHTRIAPQTPHHVIVALAPSDSTISALVVPSPGCVQ